MPKACSTVRLALESLLLSANTYTQSRSALLRSEREWDASLCAQYFDFMCEYRQLGHMTLVE